MKRWLNIKSKSNSKVCKGQKLKEKECEREKSQRTIEARMSAREHESATAQ